MADLPIDVEKVVREVLAEMGLAPDPSPAKGKGKRETAPGAKGEGSKELTVGSRVVTLAELGDRLDSVHSVVVSAGAVVTPAVRDELLRRNIALVYAEPEPLQRPGRPRLAAFATGTNFDPASMLKGLHEEGIAADCQRLDCLIATVDALVVELAKPGTLGLLLTEHVAAALCLANRVRGVRAAAGLDAASVARDSAAVGANLLVADPAAAGPFVLKQMVVQFCRHGPRDCPKVFLQRLG